MRDDPLTYTMISGKLDGTTVLKLVGPLTLSNLFRFQNDLHALEPTVLIVDMAEVVYMDSAGLGLLVNAHVSAERNGRKVLLANVNERVFTLFTLTKLDQVLQIYPSVEAAERVA